MKKVLLFVLIASLGVFALPKKKAVFPHNLSSPTDRIHFEVFSDFYKFGFDGTQQLTPSAAAGLSYHFLGAEKEVCFGLFLSPTIIINQDGDAFGDWGLIFKLTPVKEFAVGLEYKFWQVGDGLTGMRKETLAFVFGIGLYNK